MKIPWVIRKRQSGVPLPDGDTETPTARNPSEGKTRVVVQIKNGPYYDPDQLLLLDHPDYDKPDYVYVHSCVSGSVREYTYVHWLYSKSVVCRQCGHRTALNAADTSRPLNVLVPQEFTDG